MIMKALVFSMLAIASLVACTNESDPINEVDNEKPVEIKLNAGISAVETKTSGAVLPGEAVDDVALVKVDVPSDGTLDWAEATTPLAANIAAIIGGETAGAIRFDEPQYYPTMETTVTHLIGYHPKGSYAIAGGKITFASITGQEDIMCSNAVSGTKKQQISNALAFEHKLTQLSFILKANDNEAITAWGKVKSITLINQKTSAELTLSNGSLVFNGLATGTISAYTDNVGIPLTINNVDQITGKTIMVEAQQSEYRIKIVTENNTGIDIPLKEGTTTESLKGLPSTAYTVTLTFQSKNIIATATIGQWETGSGSATVE